jgi:hypothetical protein
MISETIIALRDIRLNVTDPKHPVWEKLVRFSSVEYDDGLNVVGSPIFGEKWMPVETVTSASIATTEQAQAAFNDALNAKIKAARGG